jgi:hypothetical protein
MKRFLIIGGSDAGISAALRARELDREVQLTLVVADRYPNFSICGIPCFLSGEVASSDDLAHRKAADIEAHGIRLLLEHEATGIDPERHSVEVRRPGGETDALFYDRLLLGTGAVSVRPPLPGIDLPGVFPLRWMGDTLALDDFLRTRGPRSAPTPGRKPGSTARSRSRGAWRPTCRTSMRPTTASRPGTASPGAIPTFLWGPRPTNRGGSPGRTRSAATGSSRAASAPSRCACSTG